jgi:hypothetical protein
VFGGSRPGDANGFGQPRIEDNDGENKDSERWGNSGNTTNLDQPSEKGRANHVLRFGWPNSRSEGESEQFAIITLALRDIRGGISGGTRSTLCGSRQKGATPSRHSRYRILQINPSLALQARKSREVLETCRRQGFRSLAAPSAWNRVNTFPPLSRDPVTVVGGVPLGLCK